MLVHGRLAFSIASQTIQLYATLRIQWLQSSTIALSLAQVHPIRKSKFSMQQLPTALLQHLLQRVDVEP